MNLEEKIKRINELYHKSKNEGLTEAEKEEQQRLRQEYIANVRASLKNQLDNVDIQEKDGSIVNLGEKFKKKNEQISESDVDFSKNDIRKTCLKKRDSLSEEIVLQYSKIISQKLIIEDRFKKAETVLVYASYKSEVNTDDIVKKALLDGKKVGFPKCEIIDGVPVINFYEVTNLCQLTEGYKGILEPDLEYYNLKEIDYVADLCIVPGVSFDKKGNRMGYGKGFYDRFLSKNMSRLNIALAFELQIVEKIPTNEFDIPMDMIITEENTYVFK